MARAEKQNFDQTDETRTFPHAKLAFVRVAGDVVRRITLFPGWRWSLDVGPFALTGWCESQHFQYQVSGHLHVLMSDGSDLDLQAGDVSFLPRGHDSWVVGDRPVVLIDWYKASKQFKTWEDSAARA